MKTTINYKKQIVQFAVCQCWWAYFVTKLRRPSIHLSTRPTCNSSSSTFTSDGSVRILGVCARIGYLNRNGVYMKLTKRGRHKEQLTMRMKSNNRRWRKTAPWQCTVKDTKAGRKLRLAMYRQENVSLTLKTRVWVCDKNQTSDVFLARIVYRITCATYKLLRRFLKGCIYAAVFRRKCIAQHILYTARNLWPTPWGHVMSWEKEHTP